MENKKRVLITGATGTLGTALVTALAPGHEVVGNYFHNQERAAQLQNQIGCELVRADVRDEKSVEELFTKPFDAVFHLAGVSRDALLLRLSPAQWHEHLSGNLHNSFLITRAALQHLPRGGKLVLVSSRVGERGYPGQAAYGGSKAAILGLMKSAAQEGKERAIAVNAICPGFALSAMTDSLSSQIMATRQSENWLSDADATQSFVAMCLFLLTSNQTGKIWHPDCRM